MCVSLTVNFQGLADKLNSLSQVIDNVILDILFMIRLHGGNSRFPRVEDMPHFHYDFVDLGESVKVSWSISPKRWVFLFCLLLLFFVVVVLLFFFSLPTNRFSIHGKIVFFSWSSECITFWKGTPSFPTLPPSCAQDQSFFWTGGLVNSTWLV